MCFIHDKQIFSTFVYIIDAVFLIIIEIVAAVSLMNFSQFITLGLLTLAVGGIALEGYLMCVRQDALARDKEAFASSTERKPVIE